MEFFIDTTVSVSAQSAVITGNDGFSLIIPQGLTVSPFRVQVNRPWEVDSSDGIKILNCYDVNLSFGNTFNPPLTITIPFDMSKVENIDSLKAAYYDEVSRTWVPFDSRVVQNGSFTFTTNHLTRLGVLEIITSGGYTYKFTGAKGVEVYSHGSKHKVIGLPIMERFRINLIIFQHQIHYGLRYMFRILHLSKEKGNISCSPDSGKAPKQMRP